MAAKRRAQFPISQVLPDSPITESYHTIRANIQLGGLGAQNRLVLVTSANAGEGKTSTAINLAIVSAQAGKKVLLIDADLRNPQIHTRLELANIRYGLSHALSGEEEADNCLCLCEVAGLTVIPSGPTLASPVALLSSPRFQVILAHFRSRYDLVVIDSPPVLSVSDALIISPAVDGIVFVVDSQKTHRFSAQRAVSAILQVNGTIIGGVVNRISKTDRRYYATSAAGVGQSPLLP